LQTIQPFILVLFSKLIFDELTLGMQLEVLMTYIAYMGISMIIIRVLIAIINPKLKFQIDILQHNLEKNISKHIMNIEYKYLEQPEIKNIFHKAKDSKHAITSITSMINILISMLQTIGLFTIILKLNSLILILIIVTLVIKLIGENRINYSWKKCRESVAPLERKGVYVSSFAVDHSGAKEARLNNLRDWLLNISLNISNECNVYLCN